MNSFVLALVCLAVGVTGLEQSFKWANQPPFFTNENRDFVIFNNTYGEPVYVSLQLGEKPKPVNFPLDLLIKFYLYTKKNPTDYQELTVDDTSALASSNFDKSKKTLLVVHGYMNNINSESIQAIKNNVLQVEDVNVIGVDWSLLSDHLFYHIIAAEVPGVGAYVGGFVNFLINNGLSNDNIHLIGHSLGAHVAAFAAKSVSSGKVARLTGLEPALPGFEGTGPSQRLSSDDAVFVDCIHTCGGTLGIMDPICHVDFYPNGGTNPQPGCTVLDFGMCSHGRSHEYFAESIQKGHKFPSLSCTGIPSTDPVDCTNDGSLMGYPASSSHLGVHFTKTTSAYPYATDVSQ